MSNLENELKDLKDKNNELVQKVQYWKMTAAQRENDNIELMKQVTELQLKLNTLKNGSETQANKLDVALQKTSEEVLSHLVQASSAVAHTMELVKNYMHDRQELESSLPRWSTIGDSTTTKKINKVRPMLIGGRTVQPLVLLDRTLDGTNHAVNTSDIQNHNVSERALPMHMLLDVYIPLRRIDAEDIPANNEENDMDEQGNDSVVGLGLGEGEDRISEESHNITGEGDFEESRQLDDVHEEVELEDEELVPERALAENPLEGPSWLLDRPNGTSSTKNRCSSNNQQEDTTTTTHHDDARRDSGSSAILEMIEKKNSLGRKRNVGVSNHIGPTNLSASGSNTAGLAVPGPAAPESLNEFSPTVRRRRRVSPSLPATPRSPRPSPYFSPRPGRRLSDNGRILKVLVAKMRFDDEAGGGDGLPARFSPNIALKKLSLTRQSVALSPTLPVPRSPKRKPPEGAEFPVVSPNKRPTMRFDAPSPNGATDARVIVMESGTSQSEPCCSGVSRQRSRSNRRRRINSRDSVSSAETYNAITNRGDSEDSDQMLSDSRPRRQKKNVVYKEIPLNRKMRR